MENIPNRCITKIILIEFCGFVLLISDKFQLIIKKTIWLKIENVSGFCSGSAFRKRIEFDSIETVSKCILFRFTI